MKEPKDSTKRASAKQELEAKMRVTLAAQGGFGIVQTRQWVKAYGKAKKISLRQFPTVAACSKAKEMLSDACENFSLPAAQ